MRARKEMLDLDVKNHSYVTEVLQSRKRTRSS